MESKKRYLEVADGSLLFYKVYGKGFPLFLLHGNGNDGSYFENQIDSFSQYYQVILVDSRGQGHSTNQSEKITFQLMAEDLYAIMKQEKIQKANILGFSDGANIAMMFAHLYPNMVNQLILNAGNIQVKGLKVYWVILIYLQYLLYRCISFFSETARQKCPVIELMIHDIGLSKTELSKIECPTLVIAGRNDDIKLSHTLMIANNLPHSNLVLVPKQGHKLARKDPRNFNREVLLFLKGDTNEKY